MRCVSGLEASLAVPAASGCVCGLRPSVFLRANSTSQPAADGSHQAAGNTHRHTHTCLNAHTCSQRRPSKISMVISRESDCVCFKGLRRRGGKATQLCPGTFWFGGFR